MNCKLVREKLTNALAAGDLELSSEVAMHLRSCSNCCSFYEAEAALMRSIDADLNAIVNHPLPPSLLPKVRTLVEAGVPRRNWLPTLLPVTAVLAIAALLAATLQHHKNMPSNQAIASVQPKMSERVISTQPVADPFKAVLVSPVRGRQRSGHLSRAQHAVVPSKSIASEILVGPDELRGLRLLATTVYRQPAVGEAILNPIALPPLESKAIAAQEIAPLEVASLEIRPLRDEDH